MEFNVDEEIKLTEAKLRYLNAIKNKRYSCDHSWGEVEYCPENRPIVNTKYFWQGNTQVSYEEVTGEYQKVPRWRRICSKCGMIQYTLKEEDVITKKTK